ncbi:hypothetical protein F511_44915 [Dorcoceras hygrometricum]|uniref:Uncharacterized protein n=1 Tax=Dorcoceras hygrometricum TaxID=472368 RepID=A0A2Z7AK87_9LAMI|nr:hypothetical protein F511_44915 [Dorcoceras hygrometricum]
METFPPPPGNTNSRNLHNLSPNLLNHIAQPRKALALSPPMTTKGPSITTSGSHNLRRPLLWHKSRISISRSRPCRLRATPPQHLTVTPVTHKGAATSAPQAAASPDRLLCKPPISSQAWPPSPTATDTHTFTANNLSLHRAAHGNHQDFSRDDTEDS